MPSYYESAPYNLLLVDDEAVVRTRFSALVAQVAPNINVTTATNGAEAIEKILQSPPDCVLLDYELPDKNALEVMSAIQEGPTLLIPIIIFTSHDIENLDLELLEVGATDFISKQDVTPELLKRTILRAIVRLKYGVSQYFYRKSEQLEHEKSAIEKATSEEKQKLREANRQLKFLAMHDSLTGLANRVMLVEHMTRIISSAKRNSREFYILFIDLDRFKNVNDSLGHGRGDILLLEVVCRIRNIIRTEDLMSRVGGDEFILVLDGCSNEENALNVSKKINEAVARKYTIEENEIYISASIGIAKYPNDGTCPNALLEKADSAMYAAKRCGKNTSRLYQDHREENTGIFSLEADLHNAILNNELTIHYQPKVSLKTGKVYGAEALLRWTSKSHGNISPALFIPIAEESDLIIKLGRWVREAVSHQLFLWKNTPFSNLKIAINVSGKEFSRGELLEHLDSLQIQYDLDPSLLDLEITERTVVEQYSINEHNFDSLREIGYGLSIDDFGTGYSSLSYLKNIPISELKIDRSFISSNHQKDLAITSTIINMAKNLGVRSIAEGVEEQDQVDFLTKAGCDQIQGYIFSRPLEIEKFETWVNHFNR